MEGVRRVKGVKGKGARGDCKIEACEQEGDGGLVLLAL